ncbi:MAG: SDR family oxidoreductase [Corynebacterium sp.]|uniref:SDR family oxidoreductase n=1 Tax=Corynebacterium TaxID=1716 RepID=UPI002648016C|nr:SDR family oxidoreductase [Corynebacterium sp.]MDN6282927.1 SDR family oxidoreductase [Corynebacterium sp.]MDN6305180.1 SDR family oxidoreductase [Corynebacterium sp.]MDN6353508.1 SDR family oxidoreductase [Corynebacterium sp.]MDN6367388.1 SDR family oxidoreductase [Corynebacterium sp.]MDN6376184.1 SDR family oxidoreductase [Corynebacterium sp.]
MAKAPFLSRFLTPSLPLVSAGDIALVTGVTSGIGQATAAALVQQGFRVIGTSRTPDSEKSVANAPRGVELVPLDLEDPASIAAVPEHLAALGVDASNPVTVLVNNAGESQNGPLEELPREALQRLFQVNVIGHVELTQLLLPQMRQAGRGRVVFVGSMLGSFPLAHRGSYGASKAAIKAFAFSARRELAPFGIGVSVMEPGAINTGLSERRTIYIDDQGPYADEFHTMLKTLNANEADGVSAEQVADVLLLAVTSKRPKPLYATGSSSQVAFPAARLLPRDTMAGIIAAKHGI